jgi:two-component system, NtrC family, sensor histidine kinase KinB
MFSIRQKLLLGYGGLLAIVAVIGLVTIVQIRELGDSIDIILRENYRSVVACQEMKEAIERVDSGVVFTFIGSDAEGRDQIAAGMKRFADALAVEMGNITLPGEGETSHHLAEQFAEYSRKIPGVMDPSRPLEERKSYYFSTLLPLFVQVKGLAQEILEMNQANMSDANDAARAQAASAQRRMTVAILLCAVAAVVFSLRSQRWILDPIRRLIDSANEIRRGNLDLVLEAGSRDEIGQLSEAFNAMAEGLRQIRRSDRRKLVRTRKAVSEVFKALPTAIAVLDLDDRVEVATQPAETLFGLKRGTHLSSLGYEWLTAMVRRTQDEGRVMEGDAKDVCIQVFRDNREFFFSPVVVPILEEADRKEISGTAIILNDVTSLREQQELKRSAVTTVSHQLRNPLTSIRMSVHLLLEETLGPLNQKQAELLLAARDESERLTAVVEELLDLNRMESGKALLDLEKISPHELIRDALDPFVVDARDKGIALDYAASDDLPPVVGDAKRLQHVLSNLVTNALRLTQAGGGVAVRADVEGDTVKFTVEDTGVGIPPEYQSRLFEPFFRVPGQAKPSGVGLGLAIVREIVAAHGGNVGVTSQPGAGATFWFTLPQAAAARERAAVGEGA